MPAQEIPDGGVENAEVIHNENTALFAQGREIMSVSAAKTFALTDLLFYAFLHPSADTSARTWTIPANSSVAIPVGTVLEMINQVSGGVITLAITTDTLTLLPSGSTGSRSLAANGIAWAKKIAATQWVCWGHGLT